VWWPIGALDQEGAPVGLHPFAHRARTGERRPRTLRSWAVLAAFGVATLTLAGCSENSDSSLSRLGYPKTVSDRGGAIFDLWIGSWVAAGVIGLGTFGLIVWAALRYRRRDDDHIPPQMRYNLPIEVLYTLAPVIVIAALFFHTVQTQQVIDETVAEPDHEITVIGYKWGWAFVYEGEESVGEDVFDVGTPERLSQLYLPVGESVRFTLESQDVVHSFWVPEFYYKMDVFPGENDNSFDMTPTREGVFRGRCAELCGTYHSRMLFDLNIVSAEEYEQHLAELQEAGFVGFPDTSSYSNDVEGFESGDDE